MPTESQLDIILESQLEFYGGGGLPKQNLEGNADGYGHTDFKQSEIPQSADNAFFNFTGEVIGEIVVNAKTKELTIQVNPLKSQSATYSSMLPGRRRSKKWVSKLQAK